MPLTRRTLLQSIWIPLFTAGTPEAVEVQSDGMLSVSGRCAFLLGLYQLPNRPDPWRLAREAGFQVINLPPATEEFNKAHEHGLYGWTALGSISPQRQAADEARIRKIVTTLKDHPALLFWETEDEPSFTWKKTGPRVPPETIRETYRFVKSLDPRHPLYLNHAPTNLVSTLRLYNPGRRSHRDRHLSGHPPRHTGAYALWPDGRQGRLSTAISARWGSTRTRCDKSPALLARCSWSCRLSLGRTCGKRTATSKWSSIPRRQNCVSWPTSPLCTALTDCSTGDSTRHRRMHLYGSIWRP